MKIPLNGLEKSVAKVVNKKFELSKELEAN